MRILLLALTLTAFMARADSPLALMIQRNLAAGDMSGAKQTLDEYRKTLGVTPEYLEALSWIGRAQLALKQYGGAIENAQVVREASLAQLKTRKLDADASLPTALGASIEVQAQALAAEGQRDQAVVFLRGEMVHWRNTSIYPRIRKNLNLLTLTGKAAPALDIAHWIGGRKPEPLAQDIGHPVLLFFWAHWCGDCKVEVAVIRKVREAYGPKGLEVIAPTQHYGYVAGGVDATPQIETPYINDVFDKYYSRIGPVSVPLSEENFRVYGVSTTPTVVLVDRRGIVRLYNPGKIPYEQLAAAVEPLVHAPVASHTTSHTHSGTHAAQHHNTE